MIKICIQSGHLNKAGAGAPEEQANNKRIADRLCAVLRNKGFEVYETDYYADINPIVTKTDWNLFLALHCDMDYPNDGGSGFVDFAEPSTDGATAESQRIASVIKDVYFPEVKINYVSHSCDNTRYYYMWKSLTAKTPCVLLEMGQSIDPHDKVLLANTDLIANAIAKAICKAFNVPYDSTPTIPIVSCEEKLLNVTKELTNLKIYTENLDDKVKEMGLVIAENKETISTITKELKVLNNGTQTLLENIEYYKPFKTLYENALNTQINKYDGWELIKIGVNKLIKKEGG